MHDGVDPGNCGCPQCSHDRLAARAARLNAARADLGQRVPPPCRLSVTPADTYYDRAMRPKVEPRPEPQPRPWTPRPGEKRCTRADREATADLLAEHYAAGSLDDEEYQERLDTAMSAKFPSALRSLCTDLPDLPAPPQPKPGPPRQAAFQRERASYRVWTPNQWGLQNAAAIALAIGAVAMSGATGGRLAGVSLLLCCLLNGALGLRKNRALGAVGFVSGLLLILGTALMIVLTRRRSPSRAGGLGAD